MNTCVIESLDLYELPENIAPGKATNQSSVYARWGSSKAVDRCVSTKIASNCCTHTDVGHNEAWWQVDLQTQSVIDSVTIIYRVEKTLNRLAGYEIYLSNTPDWTTGTRCHKDNTADLASVSAIQNVTCQGVARYLTIYNDRRVKTQKWYSDDAILELCEVQVYGGFVTISTGIETIQEAHTADRGKQLCQVDNDFTRSSARRHQNRQNLTSSYKSQVGRYGNGNCITDCMNCVNNICDAISGTCDGCAAGYYKIGEICTQCPSNCVGNKCDSLSGACLACEDEYFGPFCDACATGCKDPVCEKMSGNCSKCIDGYHGSTCAQTCPTNCNDNLCIKDTGFCTECVPGLYGSTCDQTCSDNCKDDLCLQGNGLCTRCKQGFHGSTCQQRCPITCKDSTCSQFSGQCEECAVGYHGIECDKNCPSNCKDRLCNQTNGRCIGCEAEYHSSNCSDSCPDNCKNHICMQENGQCIECVSGFYGSKCVDRCGYCQDGRCDKDTGNCMSSCIDGLTGDRCDVKVVVANVPSKGDDFKPAAIGIGIGCGVVIVTLVIVIIVQARRHHLGRQQNTTRSTTMTDISLPSIGQGLPTEADRTYDVIDAQKSEEGTTREYPTDDNYERLGQKEREVPHIYETK